ncbi:M20 family metallo-hydrolase [Gracilibacillus caseinilyticus]|uniref:M20 family metallo-hydrolase n=1 Tax=Gracilibacillus caseinilyticus TaxID=2932256 RepID=A0ABY4EZ63_9BACI|nr:M20 family metallo-hydrolase [Gracilibacillus caseinilyticus]UOQ48929.1 M20 family metallo-hydrolase [Gracilibacillus caseinilyticus]
MKRTEKRIQSSLDAFNVIGETDEGIQRIAYTHNEKEAQVLFAYLCKKEGMDIKVDAVGNVIARRQGRFRNAPAVAIGSHVDTVYTGGRFDGIAGVVAGLEVVRRLNEKNIRTDYPVEIIAFTSEESSRFGMSTIGSKAMTGKLSIEQAVKQRDKDGVSLAEAMKNYNFEIDNVKEAVRSKAELHSFLELHIEQGPELEKQNKKIAIATGIAAPTRLRVGVKGMAAHSGTTSMDNRKDALIAASQLVIMVEKFAQEESLHKTVATVGVFDVFPGAMNVIPGNVEFNVDIRGLNSASKHRIVECINNEAKILEASRGVDIDVDMIGDEQPVLLDEDIRQVLLDSCKDLGIEPMVFPSGAGHDAMNMQSICPTGLIFVPSHKGISHNPKEYTAIEDIALGCDLLEKCVLELSIEREISNAKTSG